MKAVIDTISRSWEEARSLYERGYRMVTLMSDATGLAQLAGTVLKQFREQFPKR